MINEVWLPIKGFEGSYEVSNLGRVRSLDRVIKRIGGRQRSYHGQDIKPTITNNGYPMIGLYSLDRSVWRTTVHRLVAIAFIDNPDKKSDVNHVDGIKTNNEASNLEWTTTSENISHAFRIGLSAAKKGVDNSNAKLTPDLIKKAMQLKQSGVSMRAIARMFGVTSTTVRNALSGKSWKHLL